MDTENGFALPSELAALRDQVGKIIREETIPIEARIRRIAEGPSEVHRMVIARSILR